MSMMKRMYETELDRVNHENNQLARKVRNLRCLSVVLAGLAIAAVSLLLVG